VFNPVSRYQVVPTSGVPVWVVSASTVFADLSWTRVTTTLTLHRDGHGRSLGDRVLLRNVNVDHLSALITRVDADTFDVTTTDTGAASGASGAYSCGFMFDHSDIPGDIVGGTLSAPSGADVQLMALRIRLGAGSRDGTTYDLILPASAFNGAGENTTDDDVFVPTLTVRRDDDSLAAVGAVLSKNVLGSMNTFRVSALPSNTIGLYLLWQF
jgi:hypothetical protein